MAGFWAGDERAERIRSRIERRPRKEGWTRKAIENLFASKVGRWMGDSINYLVGYVEDELRWAAESFAKLTMEHIEKVEYDD
jgi:hypothetical protein